MRDVEKLKKGERVLVPEYDFAANARAENGGTRVCVCVCEREREREVVCFCVCVCFPVPPFA